MTFSTWLLSQRHRQDQIGILAEHATTDTTFPRDREKLYVFLAWVGQNDVLRELVKFSHREWRTVRQEGL
jgi:uncharacterized protein YozE (UPF0346 family)